MTEDKMLDTKCEDVVVNDEQTSEKSGVNVEIVDQIYRLDEMADAMTQSIANAQKVAKEQALLIGIVNASSKAKAFTDFVKATEKQIDNINGQINTLVIRSNLLRQVVAACKNDENVSKIVSITLKALGVFEQN